jgi:hypothetical protein
MARSSDDYLAERQGAEIRNATAYATERQNRETSATSPVGIVTMIANRRKALVSLQSEGK